MSFEGDKKPPKIVDLASRKIEKEKESRQKELDKIKEAQAGDDISEAFAAITRAPEDQNALNDRSCGNVFDQLRRLRKNHVLEALPTDDLSSRGPVDWKSVTADMVDAAPEEYLRQTLAYLELVTAFAERTAQGGIPADASKEGVEFQRGYAKVFDSGDLITGLYQHIRGKYPKAPEVLLAYSEEYCKRLKELTE